MHGHFHALLVEGTSGVGKSTLIDALLRRHIASAAPRKIRSLVHLAQTHTYGPLAPFEDAGTLTASENLAHLERIVSWLEWLHDAHAHSPIPSFAVVDTLHLTHCFRPGVISWDDAEPYDNRLAAIGCKLAVVTASREDLRVRSIDARAGTQFLEQYARKFGSTNEEVLDYFVAEQEKLVELARRSSMEWLLFDALGEPESSVEAAFESWRA